MKRRKNLSQSSLELFLDTICNTFGGILLIAILIAVQIRDVKNNTESNESPSPEIIMQLQEELDRLAADIKLAAVLRQTIQNTIPKPKNENEKERVIQYNQLSNKQGNSTTQKTELTANLLKQKNQNIQLEKQLNFIDTEIKSCQDEIKNLTAQIQNKQNENKKQRQSIENLQNEIDTLNQKIAQKEKNQKQHDSNSNARNENFYLPKLHESKTNKSIFLVLRFNRLYAAHSQDDFIRPEPNQLGTPKKDRGIVVDISDTSKEQIRKFIQQYNKNDVYMSVIVYGDSADQFYIVRDVLVVLGFEYKLLPSDDAAVWSFGKQNGASTVQ
jgi:hypothetical protein